MREDPSLDDYLATGALANVPFWIYLLLLSFGVHAYAESNPVAFYTIVPVSAMLGGGFIASYMMCSRIRKHSIRSGILFGISATLINVVFGLATQSPAASYVAALCFVTSTTLAVIVRRRKDKEIAKV